MLLALFCLLLAAPAIGQTRSNVVVDFAKGLSVLTDTSLGVPSPTFDGNSFNQAGAPICAPPVSQSRAFRATTESPTSIIGPPKPPPATKGPRLVISHRRASFPSFALFAEKLGQAVIVVNYGTNFDGDGGGEPVEAAAWVAYANGDPPTPNRLGKTPPARIGIPSAIGPMRGQAPLRSTMASTSSASSIPCPSDSSSGRSATRSTTMATTAAITSAIPISMDPRPPRSRTSASSRAMPSSRPPPMRRI